MLASAQSVIVGDAGDMPGKLCSNTTTAPTLTSDAYGATCLSSASHLQLPKTVALVGLTRMHKTGCSGETRLVLRVPSSS